MMNSAQTLKAQRLAAGITREVLGLFLGKSKDWIKAREVGVCHLSDDQLAAALAGIAALVANDPVAKAEADAQAAFAARFGDKDMVAAVIEAREAAGASRDAVAAVLGLTGGWLLQRERGMVALTAVDALRIIEACGIHANTKHYATPSALLALRQRYGFSAAQMDELAGKYAGWFNAAERGEIRIGREVAINLLGQLKEQSIERRAADESRGGIYFVRIQTEAGIVVKFGFASSRTHLRARQTRAVKNLRRKFDASGYRVNSCGFSLGAGIDPIVAEAELLRAARALAGTGLCVDARGEDQSEFFRDVDGDLVANAFAAVRAAGLLVGAVPVLDTRVKAGIDREVLALLA